MEEQKLFFFRKETEAQSFAETRLVITRGTRAAKEDFFCACWFFRKPDLSKVMEAIRTYEFARNFRPGWEVKLF